MITGSAWEPELESAVWRVEVEYAGMPSLVLEGPLEHLLGTPHEGAEVRERPWPQWWPLTVGRDEPTDAEHHVLTAAETVGHGAVTVDGEVLSVVRGAMVGEDPRYLHFARLAVRPDARRQGLPGRC